MASGKRVEYWKSTRNKRWYFHLRSRNGKTTASGEGYTQSGSLLRQAHRDYPDVPCVRIGDPNAKRKAQ